jgi:DNA-binding transcriptional MerR regulator
VAKSPNAFRTISEAAEEVGAPQHVLRFWETKFTFVSPLKRAGGRRFYRPQDIVLLKAVRRLLHDEGLTIKGVQRLHREQGLRRIAAWGDPEGRVAFEPEGESAPPPPPPAPAAPTVRLRQVLAELEGARARLEAVLSRSA